MDSKEVLAENSKLFRENLPGVTENFSDLCGTVFKDGKLSLKEKELIALAIAITVKCEGCIVHHTTGCVEAGCTMEEISEMIGVCVAMGGGPSKTFAGKALQLAEELLK